jgi:hypothetical protein
MEPMPVERHRFLQPTPLSRHQEKDSGVGGTMTADAPNA